MTFGNGASLIKLLTNRPGGSFWESDMKSVGLTVESCDEVLCPEMNESINDLHMNMPHRFI